MKQRSSILMRVMLCKIQCPPLFSLCKPSKASSLYTSAPLKLENDQIGPNSSSVSVVSVVDVDVDVDDGSEKIDGSSSDSDEGDCGSALKSCVKKRVCNESGECGGDVKDKKKVQWVDSFGKELVEIKEFESSETGDADELENRTCSCLIL